MWKIIRKNIAWSVIIKIVVIRLVYDLKTYQMMCIIPIIQQLISYTNLGNFIYSYKKKKIIITRIIIKYNHIFFLDFFFLDNVLSSENSLSKNPIPILIIILIIVMGKLFPSVVVATPTLCGDRERGPIECAVVSRDWRAARAMRRRKNWKKKKRPRPATLENPVR